MTFKLILYIFFPPSIDPEMQSGGGYGECSSLLISWKNSSSAKENQGFLDFILIISSFIFERFYRNTTMLLGMGQLHDQA